MEATHLIKSVCKRYIHVSTKIPKVDFTLDHNCKTFNSVVHKHTLIGCGIGQVPGYQLKSQPCKKNKPRVLVRCSAGPAAYLLTFRQQRNRCIIAISRVLLCLFNATSLLLPVPDLP